MGFLDNKVSQEDIERVNDIKHHPQHEIGFEDSDDADMFGASNGGDNMGFDSLFDDEDDLFRESNFGSSEIDSGSSFGSGLGGGTAGLGSSTFGGFGQSNANGLGAGPFGNTFSSAMVTNQEQKPDRLDILIDSGADIAKSVGSILVDMYNSLKLRTAQELGEYSRNIILVGFFMIIAGFLLGIIGIASGIRFLSFSGISTQLMLCGALSDTFGITLFGIATFILIKLGNEEANNIDSFNDIPQAEDNVTYFYEEDFGKNANDLFDSNFNDLFSSSDTKDCNLDTLENEKEEPDMFEPELEDISTVEIDFAEELKKINENVYISRETLFRTFKGMFPTHTQKFAEKKEIDESSQDFKTLETICRKALANIANCDLSEIDTYIESISEGYFSYELKLKRINKVKKVEELSREIEIYMQDGNNDGINATVTMEGDFYKIIITKGESAIVTFGDVFKLDYCEEFFLNTKNKLPMITGIDELGNVILDDAKNFDTMLIAGKPRSGKSWYVLSVLMCLMLFNAPDQVQFIIVDPKESNLFKTIALMPHICGMHDSSRVIKILDDIIEVEAVRRKKLLADNKCDDIWALKTKGVNLPILYLVIDEYITVMNTLEKDEKKDFDNKIQIIISQLPSQGIRLIFVPHRATGVVNKTNRTMLQFTAAVKLDVTDVKDTLGIGKWDRPLTKQGDLALKTTSLKNAVYARGAALTTEDDKNTEFIENAAKAFYKMGVDIPDMHNMRIACNRDEKYIQEQLGDSNIRVQYTAKNVIEDLENIDFDTL